MHKLIKLSTGCYIDLTEMPEGFIKIETYRPANIKLDGHEGGYEIQRLLLSRDAAIKIAEGILKHEYPKSIWNQINLILKSNRIK